MFHIVELTYPGTWLKDTDRDWARDVELVLGQISSLVAEAALALSLFEQALMELAATHSQRQKGPTSGPRPNGLQEVIERGEVDLSSGAAELRWIGETERETRRAAWRTGQLPDSYRHHLPFVYARSYLFAMDRLDRLVNALADMARMPQTVVEAPRELRRLMPDLRGVRNSAAHVEDRIRGLDRRGRALDLKPIENRFISAPNGGVLAIENLCGNQFGSTMDDGSYGEVEVSADALQKVGALVQQVIDAFEWTGPPRFEPS